jgi:hypothetical protein
LQQGLNGYAGAADTYINSDAPDTNYGASAELDVRTNDTMATLLYFDLTSQIPAGVTIQSATLSVYAYQRVPSTASLTARLYRMLRAWNVNETTWNSATLAETWGLPGANDTVSDRSDTPTVSATWNSTGLKTFNVTNPVQTWYADPASNRGVVIKGYGTAGRLFRQRSSEFATIAMRPKLVIVYTTAAQREVWNRDDWMLALAPRKGPAGSAGFLP